MSSLGTMEKAPDDELDYDVDFARWLPSDDRITAASATIEDASDGSTIAVDDTQFSDTAVKVWLRSGAAGDAADVVIVVTTSEGRTKEACFHIRVRDC